MYPTDAPDCASGDLIVVVCTYRAVSVALTNSATGGQTWNTLTEQEGNTTTQQLFWCQFNGTWTADPAFTVTTGTAPMVTALHVFRPADGSSHVWGVDVAQSSGTFSAPTTPFDVTITGLTPNMDTTVVIATVATADDNTWVVQTSGWAPESRGSGTNTPAGSDHSQVMVSKIHYPRGTGSGNVVIRQTQKGGDAGVSTIIVFK